ncbi:hypothetical protein CTE05_25850 [Cellulomonas terrae]|uniref:Uncharacterized protein n=1 Tax=Cellulomonas terrae TaxID=311234 RepID=A0A511JM29_9CELL|nr:hypothetical protein CTE05_25850 [Cellulomonas terrae]
MLRRVRSALLLLAVAVAPLLVATPAAAETCTVAVELGNGAIRYETVECGSDGGTTNPGGGDGGGEGPTCYLGRKEAMNYQRGFCDGALSCYQYVPAPSASDPSTWPAKDPAVSPAAIWSNQACFSQPPAEALVSNEYLWVEPGDVIDLEVEATVAYGNLATPAFSLGFNPPRLAVVDFPTWFWAEGATAGTITGSSAAGMVASGRPLHLEIDPGDGSGTQTCPFSTVQSDACASTYERSSAGQSRIVDDLPVYTARARLVYAVTYAFNGAPMTIASAPDTLASPWQDAAVPVAEIQTLVGPRP